MVEVRIFIESYSFPGQDFEVSGQVLDLARLILNVSRGFSSFRPDAY
jgi:hypothetical protein